MTITLKIPEWIAYIGVILIALKAVDITLLLIKRYYQSRINKFKNK